MAKGSHYEVLGVQPTADQIDIRRAYLDLARRHHPDRVADASRPDATGSKMREVNEAWRVLGEPVRRRRYDLELAAILDQQKRRPPGRPSSPPRKEYIPTAPVESEAAVRVVGLIPWVLAVAVLAGIFVFTAYATGANSTPSATTAPVSVPEVIEELVPGTCIRLTSGGSFLIMDCNASHDGQVEVVAPLYGPCPAGTRLLNLPADDVTACVT